MLNVSQTNRHNVEPTASNRLPPRVVGSVDLRLPVIDVSPGIGAPPLFRRRMRIRGTRCDRRKLLQAFLELRDDLQGRTSGPGVADSGRWVFLFRIGDKIDGLRLPELGGRGPPIALFIVENQFPVAP